MDDAPFDQRGDPTLPVREGGGEWASTYETSVQDERELRLFARLGGVEWAGVERAESSCSWASTRSS